MANSVSAWIERVERVEESVGLLGLWKTGCCGLDWLKKINAATIARRVEEAESRAMRGGR